MVEMSNSKISRQEALHELWRRGSLSFLLDKNQKDLYSLFHNSTNKINTWLLARRSGKSYALCVLAIETCLRKPNAIIKFVAPTKLQIATILRPLFRKVLDTCPPEIQPVFRNKEVTYFFQNGSEIQLAGSDSGHIEKLRGGDADICIIDEAGDVDDLKNAVYQVLLPTTLTTKGKVIISGTPPKYYEHEFIHFIEKAEAENALIKRTIYDNPRLDRKDIDDLIKELGGEHTSAAQRELFCIIAKDENLSVIPEFTKALKDKVVKEWTTPDFYDSYVAMDLGFDDLTFLVFGYFDFLADKVIIQDEICYDFKQKETSVRQLTKLISEKEHNLWYNKITNELKVPHMRVSDLNPIVTNEIYAASKDLNIFPTIHFTNSRKDDKAAAISNLRKLLGSEKVIISPKCKNLIRHLENVRWRSLTNKTDYARSADEGHYDGVDALIYLTRMMNYSKNPFPPGYTYTTRGSVENYMIDRYGQQTSSVNQIDAFKKIFGIKRK